MGWGPGPAKGGQNFQNRPSLWRHLQKSPTENEKRFFRFWLQDLLNPWMVWIALSSSIVWRVIGLQNSAKKGVNPGPKGLKLNQLIAFYTCRINHFLSWKSFRDTIETGNEKMLHWGFLLQKLRRFFCYYKKISFTVKKQRTLTNKSFLVRYEGEPIYSYKTDKIHGCAHAGKNCRKRFWIYARKAKELHLLWQSGMQIFRQTLEHMLTFRDFLTSMPYKKLTFGEVVFSQMPRVILCAPDFTGNLCRSFNQPFEIFVHPFQRMTFLLGFSSIVCCNTREKVYNLMRFISRTPVN